MAAVGCGGGALLLCCLLLLDGCACLLSVPLRLPKLRQRDPRCRGAADVQSRISLADSETAASKRRRRSSLKLNSYPDQPLYYGEVKFGTPPQPMRILFDTGSADLWVLHTSYFLRNSTTFRTGGDTLSITYADSTRVTGNLSADTISFGNFTIGNQTFLLITHVNYAHDFVYDGIMGLAATAAPESPQPPLHYLLQNGMLTDGTFSLYLSSNDSTEVAGEVTFGGSNPDYYTGDFFYTSITKPCCWQIAVNGISVAGKSAQICAGGCQALVDSGTVGITGPSEDIGRLHQFIGARQASAGAPFEVDCSVVPTLPSIVVTIGGRAFPLLPHQYSYVSAGSCVTVFSPLDAQNIWILGTAFLKAYYTKFDLQNRRIGFASLKEAGTPTTGSSTFTVRPATSGDSGSASACAAFRCLWFSLFLAYLFIKLS